MATISLVTGISEAKSRVSTLLSTIGRAALHSQFPNDFEYYLCALELVDPTNEDNVLEYLVFPIMPSNINIKNTKLQNVTKTAAGVVVLENNTFVPIDISISGNFGRRLKTLSSKSDFVPFAVTSQTITGTLNKISKGDIKLPEFSSTIKTGYGITKVLERIYDKSSSVINGSPALLYFYNFAFNSHYLVQPLDLTVSQSEGSSNMIWEYNLQMRAIAPANEIKSNSNIRRTLSKFLTQDVINKGVQSSLDFVKNQKTILSNQILQKIGNGIGIDDALNRTPQLIKTVTLP